MQTHRVKYRGVELEVEGMYEEGENATYDYPGSPDQFDIEAIYVDTQDIFELLTSDQIDEIEVKILQNYYD
jgi:hypothetical protein